MTPTPTPTPRDGVELMPSDAAIAQVVKQMAATGWQANSYSTCYEGKRIIEAARTLAASATPQGEGVDDILREVIADMALSVPRQSGVVQQALVMRWHEQLREVRKALTTPTAAPADGREWLPIESAPKDGRTELLFYNQDWYETQIGIRPEGCPDDAAATRFPHTAIYPSHWMPLPEPPAAIAAKGAGQ